MFLVNGKKATLLQFNRNKLDDFYDDEDIKTTEIVLCPYNQDINVAFGKYTVPEAEGYFIIKRATDVKEGDQIEYDGRTFTIIQVRDNWIFNRIESYTVAVK
jgi:hypothetical protein